MRVTQLRFDFKMKPFWIIFLIFIGACSAVVIFAPWLGLGEKSDFFLYRSVGVPRTLALFLLLSPVFLLILYEVLEAEIQEVSKDIDFTALIVVVAATFIGWATLLINFRDRRWNERFFPEHIDIFRMADTQPQRLAFYIFLLAIAMGALLSSYCAGKFERKQPNSLYLTSFIGILIITAALGNLIRFDPVFVLVTAAILSSVAALARHRYAVKILWASTAFLIILAIIPGFLLIPVWTSPNDFFWPGPDLHYATVLAQGERLAAGRLLFIDNSSIYGVLIPIFIGLFSKFSHALSFSELMRLVQVGQSLTLIALIGAAWVRTRGSPIAGRAVAMFFVTLNLIPWLENLGPAIWFPNQSGLRFLMLMVGVLIASLLKNAGPRVTGALVGATAGIAVLYNLETGVAVTAGLGVAWLIRVREEKLSMVASSAVTGVATMSAIFIAIATIYRVSFGATLIPSFDYVTSFIGVTFAGFAGSKLSFDPLALLVLVHAAYIFVLTIRAFLDPRLQMPDLPSASIATMLLILFPYYVLRPHTFNFWIFTAIYSVLFAPLIALHGRRLVPLTIVTFLILPPSLEFLRGTFFPTAQFIKPPDRYRFIGDREKGCADGLFLPETLCKHLKERAATLKQMAADNAVVWITIAPMLTMRMSGLPGSIPAMAIFAATSTPAIFDELLESIRRVNPRILLFDDPHDRFVNIPPQAQDFNARLIHALGPNYCHEKIVGGWQVFERSNDCG